jgi:hypothetical protein
MKQNPHKPRPRLIVSHGGYADLKSYQNAELKLVGVARASLEELLLDYQDFLRERGLPLWGKGHPRAREVRADSPNDSIRCAPT